MLFLIADVGNNYRGQSGRTSYCFPRIQGSSPGLRDNAPLALKEGHDFSLRFSISLKPRVSIAKAGSTSKESQKVNPGMILVSRNQV